MSADVLRRAAASMRERAEGASPGPWHVCDEPPADADSAVTNADHDPVAVLLDEWYEAEMGEPTAVHDAAHIASWHPAVALTVADWLDTVARLTVGGDPGGPLLQERALAAAHAYLGDPS